MNTDGSQIEDQLKSYYIKILYIKEINTQQLNLCNNEKNINEKTKYRNSIEIYNSPHILSNNYPTELKTSDKKIWDL